MLFNSYLFILFFLPLSLLGYFFLSGKEEKINKKSLLWLIVLSLWFYSYGNPKNLLILLFTIAVNYYFSWKIKERRSHGKQIKLLLTIALCLQIGFLAVYKYTNFFLEVTKEYHHITQRLSLAVPLGISFFTFSQISFLLDTSRGEIEEKVSFMEYMAYVTWFPKLTMGPIMTFQQFVPLLKNPAVRRPDYRNLSEGLYCFTIGLAKKILIADTLAKMVGIGFADVYLLNTMTALTVMLSYTLQIYFDFSGYCDMAVGIGRMFNLTVPENFNSPYKALSISDFWKRWHMTLTSFFTRYLYIPLGGSRKGKLRTYVNTFVVFLISGLWHGAAMTYVLWGMFHGIFMVAEKAAADCYEMLRKKITGMPMSSAVQKKIKPITTWIRWAVTFTLINLTWVMFRVRYMYEFNVFVRQLFLGGWQLDSRIRELFSDLIEIRVLKRFGLTGFLDSYQTLCIWILLLVLTGSCVFLKNRKEKLPVQKFGVGKSMVIILLLIWCICSLSDITTFLYFEF